MPASSADDHRVEKQMTLIDETGFYLEKQREDSMRSTAVYVALRAESDSWTDPTSSQSWIKPSDRWLTRLLRHQRQGAR